MRQILVIASKELFRLQRRFRGSSSPLTVLALILMLGFSAYTMRNTVSLGNGLYRVGVSGDASPIDDARFAVMAVDAADGQNLLDQHAIDVWVNGGDVIQRQDDRSQFAVRALKQYLEVQELRRVAGSYEEDAAFPLRVGINYINPPGAQNADNPQPNRPEEIIIPSLTPPPAPFAQVLVAMIYIFPITFISIFFTSSFMDEKANRRLTILLSAPITPFQIVMGKMLPYAIFALLSTAVIATVTNVPVWLALAIFAPTILFIFAIYLMVPMFYRTFKDITFIAMFVTTTTTAYLVFPAMFTNVNDLAYISPLALAVKMYRGEAFGLREYLFPSVPMAAIFGFTMFAATRMLNEEFMMGYRPISRKIADAIYLILAHSRLALSVPLWSLLTIPAVYMAQVVFLAISSNLPFRLIVAVTLFLSVLVEEVIKSISITVLAERDVVKSWKQIVGLSFLSGLGFLIGEKLLLLISLSFASQGAVAGVMFGGQGLFVFVTLFAHAVFTTIVTSLRIKLKVIYPAAVLVGTVLHFIYNWILLEGLR